MEDLTYRSEYLFGVFEKWVDKDWSVLEIGSGMNRNVDYLNERGYNVEGIDKEKGSAIEDVEPKEYDVIYTMSCLFLIPPENNWVFEKIAKMAKRYIITIEGETASLPNVWGRNYTDIFMEQGFKEVERQKNVFNEYGVLRVLKRV